MIKKFGLFIQSTGGSPLLVAYREDPKRIIQLGIAPVSVTRKFRRRKKPIFISNDFALKQEPAVDLDTRDIVYDETHIDLKARNVFFGLLGKL